MKKYEKEVVQAQLDNEKEVLKKLERNYEDALEEINDKIAQLLGRADSDQQYVVYQVEFQKSLKKQVEAILETLHSNEFETVSEYLTKSYEEGFVGAMYELQKQGIPLVFPIDQEQVVEAIQTETNLSESLYTAMGHDIKDLQKKIAGEITRGIATGQMYSEMSRNIASWARIPKNNAVRIARTEAHRIQEKAIYNAQNKAKSKGADIVKIWSAVLDAKTRDSHANLDGEIKELDEKFSNGLMYPGDPNGSAGEVINCRCRCNSKARWLLGHSYTKWSPDAPVIIDDEGTTQFVQVDAKSYKEFKGYYKDITGQMTMNFVNGNPKRVRPGVQKIKPLENNDKSSRMGARGNSGKAVFFDENNDYTLKIDGVSDKVNGELSKAARKVASLGTEDGKEHMFLIDLDGGLVPYYETNGMTDKVGFDFWKYAEEHKDKRFAFIHNHNTDSPFSQTDLETPLYASNIPVQIAVTNDGVKYIAKRVKEAPKNYIPDEYFSKELEELNRKSRAKEVTPIERMVERERIITESLEKEFYERIEIVDGRK